MEDSQTKNLTSCPHSIIPDNNKKLPNIQVAATKLQIQNDKPNKRRPTRVPTKPITQHKGFSRLPKYSHIDEPWGHLPEEIDTSAVFRVLLQNPNGLKFSEGDDLARYSFSEAYHLGVGALCLPETNTNWNIPSSLSKLSRIIRPIWQSSCTQTSHINDEFENIYQPGGTLTTICNNWTSRILEKGSDPYGLGRWSFFILQGKGTVKIAIITAYQVCSATLSSLGPTTYARQQERLLSNKFREADILTQPNPRQQFILDLQAWVEHLILMNHDIILSLDANEDYTTSIPQLSPLTYTPGKHILNTKHDGTLATLLKTCGLVDPVIIHHSTTKPPPTYSRGKHRIDYIFISNALLPSTVRSGILPYNHPFLGDHRPCFLDFNAIGLFRDSTQPIEPPKRRGLQLFDPRKINDYLTEKAKQLDYHKVQHKKERLYTHAETGTWDPMKAKQYNRLDSVISESMLRAEKVTTRVYSSK